MRLNETEGKTLDCQTVDKFEKNHSHDHHANMTTVTFTVSKKTAVLIANWSASKQNLS